MTRAKQIWLALDGVVNAFTGGYAGEVVSARAWRLRESHPFIVIRPTIDFVALHVFRDPDHCRTSYLNLLARKNLPAEYQNSTSPPPAA